MPVYKHVFSHSTFVESALWLDGFFKSIFLFFLLWGTFMAGCLTVFREKGFKEQISILQRNASASGSFAISLLTNNQTVALCIQLHQPHQCFLALTSHSDCCEIHVCELLMGLSIRFWPQVSYSGNEGLSVLISLSWTLIAGGWTPDSSGLGRRC